MLQGIKFISPVPLGWYIYFGFGLPYVLNGEKLLHAGVDMTGPDSNFGKVVAAASGVVQWAYISTPPRYGVVIIQHTPTLYSRYLHLQKLQVRGRYSAYAEGRVYYAAGQKVQAGDLLGYTRPEKQHLHFEILTTAIANYNPGWYPGNSRWSLNRNLTDPEKQLVHE